MKIIIIAQPKTASTSLMDALGEITGMTHEQCYLSTKRWKPLRQLVAKTNNLFLRLNSEFRIWKLGETKLKDRFPACQYPTMSTLHSDIADFPADAKLHKYLKADIHKQHFPPTSNNIAILTNIPKVILVRPPEETIDSYRRVKSLHIDMRRRLTNSEFCDQLKGELMRWQEGWILASHQDPKILVIRKDDVVNRTVEVLRSILCIMDLADVEIPPDYRLPERRYFRH